MHCRQTYTILCLGKPGTKKAATVCLCLGTKLAVGRQLWRGIVSDWPSVLV